MTAGRPRKPVNELKLHGGYRPDRHGDRSDPECVGVPVKPPDMDQEAEWLWDFVVDELTANGTLKRVDTPALMCVCDLWAKYRKVSKAADGDPGDKDLRCSLTAYYGAYQTAASKIGLSPVDRTRVKSESDSGPKGLSASARKRTPA